MLQNLVHQAVVQRLLSVQEAVPLHAGGQLVPGLPGAFGQQTGEGLAALFQVAGVDEHIAGLTALPPRGWWIITSAWGRALRFPLAPAALDDLAAVIKLIGRGYHLSFWDVGQPLSAGEPDDSRDWYLEICRPSYKMCQDAVRMKFIGHVHQKKAYLIDMGYLSDPLSVAIWCRSLRCIEPLLPAEAEDLSQLARNALSWGPLPGDEARRQAVEEIVCRKYGIELAELLTPGDFGNRNSPLFLPCLERHPEWFNLSIASHFVQEAGQT